MLACLAPSLTRLNLSYNILTKMGSPSNYPAGLKHLDLSHNQIDTWTGEQRVQYSSSSGDICYSATLNSIYEEKQSPTSSSPSSTSTSSSSSHMIPENRKLLRLHHSKLAGKMERQGSANMLLSSPEKSGSHPCCTHKKHTRLESLRTLILSDNNLHHIFVHCCIGGSETNLDARSRKLSCNDGNEEMRSNEKRKNTSERSEKKSSQKSGNSSVGTSNTVSGDLKAVKLRIMFPMLSMLDVSNNKITDIPSTIHELSNLSVLNVSGNSKIVDLPPQMGLLQKLWNLNTRGCNLQEPLATMMSSKSYKTSDVIGYLRSILENSKPYARLKLMVVGIQGNDI